MSIVEKALSKLQTAAVTQRADSAVTPAGKSAITRVVGMEAAQEAGAALAPEQRRVPIASAEKKVYIDRERLHAAGLLPPKQQEHELAQEYRSLKRPLLKHAFGAGPKAVAANGATLRSIMVTSAMPGEGKTFTTLNLALSLALEKDHSVLLVDCDIPKPHISQTFGLQAEPGLLDALADASISVESLVRPTDVNGLCILPVGQRTDTAPELLASARMRHVMSRLEQLDPHGLLLIDSPPVLLTSEARVLASLFGQVVVVVCAGVTQQQAVSECLRIVGEGPRIGLLLNQALHERPSDQYYGYYYGSGTAPGGSGLEAGQHAGADATHGK